MIETAIYEVLAGTVGSDSPNWHKEFTLRLMRNRPDQPMNPRCDATMWGRISAPAGGSRSERGEPFRMDTNGTRIPKKPG
jgi:hypothetical protein